MMNVTKSGHLRQLIQDSSGGPSAGSPHVHIVSIPTLLTVFAALLLLTFLTIGATAVDTGRWEIWISIGIATLKATLVALYFMHLRFDKSFHSVVFLAAIATLGLFLMLTLSDVDTYYSDVRTYARDAATEAE